MNNNWTQER